MIIRGKIEPPDGSPSLTTAGPDVVMQPGRKIAYRTDGTSEGTAVFVCDKAHLSQLPKLGYQHPDDETMVCHHIELTFNELDKATAVCYYHGLSASYETLGPDVIDYPGGNDQLPIQLHPNFEEMAGTKNSPLHGAEFDADTGEFLGFFDPAYPELFGVEHYLVSRPLVYRTYWTRLTPSLDEAMTIVNSIPGFSNPPGIENWLIVDTPYRQVGNAYQVTIQYKGSPPPGWSDTIYPG